MPPNRRLTTAHGSAIKNDSGRASRREVLRREVRLLSPVRLPPHRRSPLPKKPPNHLTPPLRLRLRRPFLIPSHLNKIARRPFRRRRPGPFAKTQIPPNRDPEGLSHRLVQPRLRQPIWPLREPKRLIELRISPICQQSPINRFSPNLNECIAPPILSHSVKSDSLTNTQLRRQIRVSNRRNSVT